MLIYHPAFDPYHAAFRLVAYMRLRDFRDADAVGLNIIDALWLFPGAFLETRLPRAKGVTVAKRSAEAMVNPFSGPRVVSKPLFYRLRSVHLDAVAHLAARNVLCSAKFDSGIACVKDQNVPDGMRMQIEGSELWQHAYPRFLAGTLLDLGAYGKDGLKARTGLMEWRYDAV